MEALLQPREVVLDFGLLPLQVLCPQLETVAGVRAAHRSLAALATTGEDGNKYVTCASVAAVLDLPDQQCQLLLDTLEAVSCSSSSSSAGQASQPRGGNPPAAAANLHQLSLFLLAQIYGREAVRPETQDHWPEAASSSGAQLEVFKPGGRITQPGSPGGNNSRMLIKAQLQQLQRQHAAYSRGYADFLERHQKVLLELVLDDSSPVEAWQQQRAQQHRQQQQQDQQQQQQPPQQQQQDQQQQQQLLVRQANGDGDSEMTPVEEPTAAAAAAGASHQAEAAAGAGAVAVSAAGPMEDVQQGGAQQEDGSQMQTESPNEGAAQADTSSTPFSSTQQQQQQQGLQLAGSMPSGLLSGGSSGSLTSLGGASISGGSFPPVAVTAAEFDRLGFLLQALQVSRSDLAALLEASSSGSSSRSLITDAILGLSCASSTTADQSPQQAGSSSSGSGGNGSNLAATTSSSSRLSSFVPGYSTSPSLSLEDCCNWMSSCWLHKLQKATLQQHKVAAAATAAGSGAAPAAAGVSPLLQQPAFGGTAAAGDAVAKQPAGGGSSGGVANLLAEMSASAGCSSGSMAGWLGLTGSPPNTTSQQLSMLGSPGAFNTSSTAAAAAGGGFGSFISGINGVPVVTSVTSGGPSPATPPQGTPSAAAAAAGGNAAAAAGTSSPAVTPTPSTSGAGGPSSATAAAGVASLLGGSPVGLGSIRVCTTRGMVAVAGGCVDERQVTGVYRGTVVRGPADVAGDCVTIQDCSEAHIYLLAPVKLCRIVNCSDCHICVGAVSTLLRIERCERLQLTAAAGQVLVVSSHSCCLHLGTPRQPAILGDCRFVKLAPYNTRYETLYQHLAAAGIATGKPSLWDVPLIITSASGSISNSGSGGSSSCGGGSGSRGGSGSGAGAGGLGGSEPPNSTSGAAAALQQQRRPGASTPSSPHTHGGSSSAERRGGAAAPKPVLLLPPEEFVPLVIPFRGTSGPLAGGAAHHASTHWLPNSHKSTQGPLPPFPFTLPPEYDAALQQQYGVVTELRSKIKGSGLDEARRAQLQNVIQGYFREWLHSSGAIRQVYDLSKLEGDEYGLSGSSPPALRDTPSL